MRYETATAFRTALEDRLRRMAGNSGQPSLQRLRKTVVFDRLLARLLVVAPDRWVLKGGVALDLRLGDRARTTRDLDLARRDTERQAMEDLLATAEIDLDDYFEFAIERTGALDPKEGGIATRYRVRATLADRTFEDIIVDIGFGDDLPQTPDLLPGPDLLGFAGIARIVVPALPLECHLAEKLHAYTRIYGGEHPSSRVKDLIDIVLIQTSAAFRAGRLSSEMERTFAGRATHELPRTLPLPPADWATPYRTLANEVSLNPEIEAGFRLAADFLDPVLGGQVDDGATWEPATGQWSPSSRVGSASVDGQVR